MPTNTLPPGWTGNNGEQTYDVGPFRLHAFGGGSWGVSVPAAGPAWILYGYKWPDTMPEARDAAVAGFSAMLTAALAHPALTPKEP